MVGLPEFTLACSLLQGNRGTIIAIYIAIFVATKKVGKMRTVMTLDEELVQEVDRMVRRLGTSRSKFARSALRHPIQKADAEEMERRQREGYRRHPAEPGEFSDWEDEQVWID